MHLESALPGQMTVGPHTRCENHHVCGNLAAIFEQDPANSFIAGKLLDLDSALNCHLLLDEMLLQQARRLGRKLAWQQPVEAFQDRD